jgi:hypothetical protein
VANRRLGGKIGLVSLTRPLPHTAAPRALLGYADAGRLAASQQHEEQYLLCSFRVATMWKTVFLPRWTPLKLLACNMVA